jgi:UDPglucose--hexose-1-phosphate uridylyltransferase
MPAFYKRHHRKADGRELILYSLSPLTAEALPEPLEAFGPAPHLRYHPLRREWVVYATHRQERTFLPPKEHCPPLPEPGGELPYGDPLPRVPGGRL